MPIMKRMIKNPFTSKRLRRVFVNGKGWFSWNSAYHVYNRQSDFEQLTEADVNKVDFNFSEKTTLPEETKP